MDTKLTLKLDKDIIDMAKLYAASQKRSLSRMIETYLKTLVSQADLKSVTDDIEISAFVKSMASGVQLPANLDYKKEYSDYLSEKYK